MPSHDRQHQSRHDQLRSKGSCGWGRRSVLCTIHGKPWPVGSACDVLCQSNLVLGPKVQALLSLSKLSPPYVCVSPTWRSDKSSKEGSRMDGLEGISSCLRGARPKRRLSPAWRRATKPSNHFAYKVPASPSSTRDRHDPGRLVHATSVLFRFADDAMLHILRRRAGQQVQRRRVALPLFVYSRDTGRDRAREERRLPRWETQTLHRIRG